jgi:hypothetical protein
MRRTVHQAEVSKAEAEANIIRKLNVLDDWLANGIPYQKTVLGNTLLDDNDHSLLDFYPRSLRQFKAWDGSQNCEFVRAQLPNFAATGNDTLAKRKTLEERARNVIVALRERADVQANSTRRSAMKQLTGELKIAQAIIEVRNAELREQQRKLRQIERDNATLNRKLTGDEAEFKEAYGTLFREVETLKVLNAQLTAQLAKIAPLRQADNT